MPKSKFSRANLIPEHKSYYTILNTQTLNVHTIKCVPFDNENVEILLGDAKKVDTESFCTSCDGYGRQHKHKHAAVMPALTQRRFTAGRSSAPYKNIPAELLPLP